MPIRWKRFGFRQCEFQRLCCIIFISFQPAEIRSDLVLESLFWMDIKSITKCTAHVLKRWSRIDKLKIDDNSKLDTFSLLKDMLSDIVIGEFSIKGDCSFDNEYKYFEAILDRFQRFIFVSDVHFSNHFGSPEFNVLYFKESNATWDTMTRVRTIL